MPVEERVLFTAMGEPAKFTEAWQPKLLVHK